MKMKGHDGLHLLMDCKLFANMRSKILINLCFFGRTVESKSFQNRVLFFLFDVVAWGRRYCRTEGVSSAKKITERKCCK